MLAPALRTQLNHLRSEDGDVRNAAYEAILKATDGPVDWAYEVWDDLLAGLTDKNNHVRTIAAQVLANLAKSDPQQRMLKDFDRLLAVTHDERFVTARHALLALWKVGTTGPAQQKLVMDRLSDRFANAAADKNRTLIRYDILQGMRQLYDVVKDEGIRAKAAALIETEPDLKYRKKYSTLWRRAKAA
jgi:HEAT repeat protein